MVKQVNQILMMKIIVASLFFIALQAQSQRINADSLLQIIKTAKEDSLKIDAVNSLAFTGYTPDSTLYYSKIIIEEANKQGNDNLKALGWCTLGFGYLRVGNEQKALEANLKALKIAEKHNNPIVLATIYQNLGLTLFKTDLKKSEYYLTKGVDIVNQSPPNIFYSLVLNNYSRMLFLTNRLDSAIIYAQKGYAIFNKFSNKRQGLISTYNLSMFRYNSAKGENGIALSYGRAALVDLANTTVFFAMTRAYELMGAYFAKLKIEDSALHYYHLAFETAGKTKNIIDYVSSTNWLYNYYKSKNKIDSAFYYLEILKSANDSSNNINKIVEMQSLEFEEELRQKELSTEKEKAIEERNHNIQLTVLAIGIFSAAILFLLLSRSIIVSHKMVKFLSVIVLLVVFEFINLLLHPFLETITNHSPPLMLLALVAIAALIVPLHHRLEKFTSARLVEKNKRIRLAAAKRTIAALEGDQTK
jgi:tetratricopeptide (TPR) repeat protein